VKIGEAEVRLEGWEFARPTGYAGDGEWVLVEVRVGEWRRVDPCLTIGEARELGEWLAAPAGELSFLEPNLRFVAGDGWIELQLAAECRPPGAMAGRVRARAEGRLAAERLAEEWAGELERLPARGW